MIGIHKSIQGLTGKESFTAVVRIEGAMAPLAESARKLAEKMSPGAAPPTMTPMSGQIDESIASERMMAIFSVYFAASALLVTAIGLYGTLAYATVAH